MDFGRQAGGAAAHMLLACWSFYGQNLRMEREGDIGHLVGIASIQSFDTDNQLLNTPLSLLVAKSDVIKINPGCGKRGGGDG